MRVWILMLGLIAVLLPRPAWAVCTATSPPQTANLTPLIVQGRIAATIQTFTIAAGCTRPFHVAITAVAAIGSAHATTGFDAIGYTASASVGGITASVTSASGAGAVAPKQVSTLTTSGIAGTVPITVTLRPVPGRLAAGNYFGQLVVTVCESSSGC